MSDQNKSEILIEYFYKGFTYLEIKDLLKKFHNIQISLRQINRLIKDLGLKRKYVEENLAEICSAIIQELKSSGCCLGYKTLWNRLKQSYHLDVKRETVLEILRIVDPDGIADRLRYRLKRRLYNVPGPNFIWHIDGHDKLKPFGFAIHGCIDGYSRFVVWLVTGTTNNKPEVIAHHYLKTIDKLKYIPSVIRSDCGTENTVIDIVHQALRSKHRDNLAGLNSFMKGKSTANQRIESFWGQLRRHTMDYYITLFKAMRDMNLFNNANHIHVESLRYCFGPLIQQDLDKFRKEWNNHKIRKQKGRESVSGKPSMMYYVPESFGASDFRKPVDSIDIEYCTNQLSSPPQLYDPIIERIVNLIMPNFITPTCIEEALIAYEQITSTLKNYAEDTS